MKIWLADLTYTQQSIASDVVPAGIGMIAEYTEKKIPNIEKIKLFKFPEVLSENHNLYTPDLVGFSNYVWNSSLTDIYLKRIKEANPSIFTVVGGPNFPTDKNEQKDYLEKRPYIDFYIIKEGEHAFASLVECLINNGSKEQLMELPNLVFNKSKPIDTLTF